MPPEGTTVAISSTPFLLGARNGAARTETRKPSISVLVPAYNEEPILADTLAELWEYMNSLSDRYRFEIVVVDDGSTDRTLEVASSFAADKPNVRVVHQPINFGLGQALKLGFSNCTGDYIVTMDADLSYSPHHIERLLEAIVSQGAMVAVASPYMKGGAVANVPLIRRIASRCANRLLAIASNAHLATLTGMVRAYDAAFLRSLNFRAVGMEVNADILRQAQILRARTIEIPASLRWNRPSKGDGRSSVHLVAYVQSLLIWAFLFRPAMFFLIPAALCAGISLYALIRIVTHQDAPLFLFGISLLLACQLFCAGMISLHSKKNFEDLFNLVAAGTRRVGDKT
ncbi:MAG: glycosyltransferase family 2 protein [Candidatus Eremiobacteraeota bacterium]|nr:glycosyltransferase family 2 protein [Candidatus Eremiobacteraeota bacterium]